MRTTAPQTTTETSLLDSSADAKPKIVSEALVSTEKMPISWPWVVLRNAGKIHRSQEWLQRRQKRKHTYKYVKKQCYVVRGGFLKTKKAIALSSFEWLLQSPRNRPLVHSLCRWLSAFESAHDSR